MADQIAALQDKNVKNGALLSMDPRTGEILAMVGSPDFGNEAIGGQINMTLRPRQTGSVIKPFTYLAALEKLDADEFRASVQVGGSIRVLVLGTRKDPNLVEKFLTMGCMGYLPHDVPSSTLRRAVRAIASGQVWADRSTITQVMKRMIFERLFQELTSRERDILRLIVSGLSNRAIADRLCITHETVRWHIRALYSKLGVQDRFSAVVYGQRLLDSEGIATPSEIPSIPIDQSFEDAPQKRASPKAVRGEDERKSFLIS